MKKLWISTLLPLTLCACHPLQAPFWQGYAEGDYVRVASPLAGTLSSIAVEQGTQVAVGAPLFVLEHASEQSARQEAQQRVLAAQAKLTNLKSGKRPDEIAAIVAQGAQARATLQLAETNLSRQQKLVTAGFISRAALDEAHANRDRGAAQVAEADAQIKTAHLAARNAEQSGAGAEVHAAEASLAQADWKLAQKAVPAPVAGRVEERYYRPGEWVAAGSPVLSLLPPQNIKLVFFVPETVRATLRPQQALRVQCDGCARELQASVASIATQAEYTPPVIYSRDNRAKLVYRVEARLTPTDAVLLQPGQPVDVWPK
jgi:HlyD family secretion protein